MKRLPFKNFGGLAISSPTPFTAEFKSYSVLPLLKAAWIGEGGALLINKPYTGPGGTTGLY